ncbi:aspartate racemase [Arthrobacter sp. 31Cvi3.1E]|nr:aspartate racemase [Arthrobacter sp. 31Cvi3.1E]
MQYIGFTGFFYEKTLMYTRQTKGAAGSSTLTFPSLTTAVGLSGADRSVKKRRVVGILGGMGPAATADFYMKLVQATPALSDQDHLQVIIWSDPTIPDRTEALLAHGPDPTPMLISGARLLQRAGAEMLAVPCNTAHAFLGEVQEAVDLPIVHMIEETAKHVQRLEPRITRLGLLSTTGTQKAGLYQTWMERIGVQVLVPRAGSQEDAVMTSIRAIKAGNSGADVREQLTYAATELIDAGAQAVIGGCTEIPVGLDAQDISVPFIDPAQVLAESLVHRVLAPS